MVSQIEGKDFSDEPYMSHFPFILQLTCLMFHFFFCSHISFSISSSVHNLNWVASVISPPFVTGTCNSKSKICHIQRTAQQRPWWKKKRLFLFHQILQPTVRKFRWKWQISNQPCSFNEKTKYTTSCMLLLPSFLSPSHKRGSHKRIRFKVPLQKSSINPLMQ